VVLPTEILLCGIVYCDSCDVKWVHVSCDLFLTDAGYDEMVQNSSEDTWICSVCQNNNDSVKHYYLPSENNCNLSCLCLNARNILPKHHDLFALICSISVDILAVTETFLDSSILDTEVCPKGYVILVGIVLAMEGMYLLLFEIT